jgi:3-O-methylgallate 3,4-dioxygenase
MARMVLGLGTSHSPQLSIPADMWGPYGERDRRNRDLYNLKGVHVTYDELLSEASPEVARESHPEKWQQRHRACQEGIARVGETLAEVAPDILIMVGDDQEELFHDDLMPALLIYWGDEILSKPRHYPEDASPAFRAAGWAYGESEHIYPVASGLGRHLIESLIDQGFDTAHSHRLADGKGMGHAFGFVYRRIMNGTVMPTVPIMLNTYYPPNQPTPKRCLELGKAIRRAVESWDSAARVGIIASGGLSHFVIDEELDQTVLKAMGNHDEKALATLPRERLNSGTSETRNWIVAAGAAGDLDMQVIDYVPCYRSLAGTGCAMGFAKWI